MNNILTIVILPLVFSNIIHMLVVKYELFSFLKIPLSPVLFGSNKTWRGFILLPFLNGIFLLIMSHLMDFPYGMPPMVIGWSFGFAYMLFELPNSWLKRRLGIKPGSQALKKKWFFILMDKADSSFGVSLAAYGLLNLKFMETIYLFLISCTAHFIFSFLLVMLGIKKAF